MNILIFEGMATSGKSTIISGLGKALGSLSFIKVDESETHEPIMKDADEAHIDFFKELISKYVNLKADIVAFDRLYLTQAFRAKLSITKYSEIEDLLRPHNPLTVFLEVDKDAIADRVSKAAQHREVEWGEYIKIKGDSINDIANYYINQQQNQLKLLKMSDLPYKIFNTTTHDYSSIIQEIVSSIEKSRNNEI